jgi:hypothetical protein
MGKQKNLKLVKLIEPEMCLDCRFSSYTNIEKLNGSIEKVVRCTRLDCDNWDYSSAQNFKDFVENPAEHNNLDMD